MKKHLNKSMVEFVLEKTKEITNEWSEDDQIRVLDSIDDYAYALSETPRLGHFIRCDENDVPLEEPKNYESWLRKKLNTPYDADLSKYEQYQEACDRVLFEGFYVDRINEHVSRVTNLPVTIFWYGLEKKGVWYLAQGIKTYEDLIQCNLPLTDNGAKVFGYDKPQ